MTPLLVALATRRDLFSEDSPFAVRMVTEAVSGLPRLDMRVYNGTGGTLTVNNWYEITFDGDEETNPKIVAIASGAASGVANGVVKYVCVATEAAASATWTWVTFWGYCSPFVEGATDVAKDDYLKFLTSTSVVAPVKDGTPRTVDSVAIACEAQTTAGNTTTAKVFLLGDRVQIAA